MSDITGALAITLPLTSVVMSGGLSIGIRGVLNVELPIESIVIESRGGPADVSGSLSIALPFVSVDEDALARPADVTGNVGTSLFAVEVNSSGLVSIPIAGGQGIGLWPVEVSGYGSSNPRHGGLLVRLSPLKAMIIGYLEKGSRVGSVSLTTTVLRVDDSGILVFKGPPNRVLLWEIVSGGGTISRLTEYTDSKGIAYAKYVAGESSGTVLIRVTYGS